MPTLGVVDDAEVVLPLPLAANAAEVRNREDYNIIATLKPGATIEQARAELDALTARLRREHPDFYPPNGGLTFRVLPLQEQAVGRVRLALIVLVAVGRVRAAHRVRERRQPAAVARARRGSAKSPSVLRSAPAAGGSCVSC